ncbi:hypothetical protein SAMN04488522_104306 [Pedobacter caeni]|uniref:Uncharacterized protein n=1 Tax=Pedobacter caeni TaxID=288992 RepID=A0A1M5GP12_9SPHI|nr:hypothetical protein SAMN04488522_104306 [Pedobacter caeni]
MGNFLDSFDLLVLYYYFVQSRSHQYNNYPLGCREHQLKRVHKMKKGKRTISWFQIYQNFNSIVCFFASNELPN